MQRYEQLTNCLCGTFVSDSRPLGSAVSNAATVKFRVGNPWFQLVAAACTLTGWLFLRIAPAATIVLSTSIAVSAEEPPDRERLIEGYPTEVAQSRAQNTVSIGKALAMIRGPKSAVVDPPMGRWHPGETVRVAFSGGDNETLAKIEAAALSWTDGAHANLHFQFKDVQGRYLRWSPRDKKYNGEVRVGFAKGVYGGYWSLVGTESVADNVIGGSPNAASMNLENFDRRLPFDYQAVVIHEFGHALGFEHEHQSPNLRCDFRYDDDLGYVATQDARRVFIADAAGKRPGLYTYLSGEPNKWNHEKVDANLRTLTPALGTYISIGDKLSTMMYYFESSYFISGDQSICHIPAENSKLSEQDIVGIRRAYPFDLSPMDAARQLAELQALTVSKQLTAQQQQFLQRRVEKTK
jgi:hypothetical protein